MNDAEAAALYGEGWRSPLTMPIGVVVKVRSVRGVETEAWRPADAEPFEGISGRPGPPQTLRVKVYAQLYKSTLSAVCWKPIVTFRRCDGITQTARRCRRGAKEGSTFCDQHDPKSPRATAQTKLLSGRKWL